MIGERLTTVALVAALHGGLFYWLLNANAHEPPITPPRPLTIEAVMIAPPALPAPEPAGAPALLAAAPAEPAPAPAAAPPRGRKTPGP